VNPRWLLVLAMLLVGCAAPESGRLRAPAAQVQETHFLGSAISGPLSGALPAPAANPPILLRLQLFAATELSTGALAPIASGARITSESRDRLTPVRWGISPAADELATQIHYAPANQVVKWREDKFAIPPGVTA